MNKTEIKHICFDLDGTIIDSYPTIYKSTIKTLEFLKIEGIIEEKEFYKRIGHHFLNIFQDLKVNVPDIEFFIDTYKTYYFDFIDDSVIYPGVTELFDFLKQEHIKISLLTTKAQDQAEKILEHFNLTHYFSLIAGRRIGVEIKPSPVPLRIICSDLNISTSNTVMTGDSELDIRCGKNAGALTCAALYGYRSKDELEAEGADYIISSIAEIKDIILSRNS